MRIKSSALQLAAVLMAGIVLAPVGVRARVGETRADLEKRMLAPGVGRLLGPNDPGAGSGGPAPATPPGGTPAGAAGSGRRGAGFGGRGNRNGQTLDPFRDFRPLLPKELTEVVYLKSDTPANLATVKAEGANFAGVNLYNPDTCWHLHVLYANGRSVMEAYVRVGVALSEFEVNGVLAANRGASVWKKVADSMPIESGIGTDFALDDDTVRAKQDGNTLLVFATKVDNYILEQQKAESAVEQSKAPTSVLGF